MTKSKTQVTPRLFPQNAFAAAQILTCEFR
jgi:hypothetical protein